MPEVQIVVETFNEYPNVAGLLAFRAVWPNVGDGTVTLRTGSPAPPVDLSQYCAASGGTTVVDAGGPGSWGVHTTLAAHTFTAADGIVPLAQYRIRFKMNMGQASSNGVDHFPGPHTLTAGVQANGDRYLIAVKDPQSVFGPRDDAAIPGDAHLFDYITLDAGFPGGSSVGTIFPALDGWKDYDFLTLADATGKITITFGTFDARNFGTDVYIDDITVWLIVPPRPAQRVRPQVFGVGR